MVSFLLVQFFIAHTNSAGAHGGRQVALVIGSSDAGLARLITPSEDVTDLAALLQSPGSIAVLSCAAFLAMRQR